MLGSTRGITRYRVRQGPPFKTTDALERECARALCEPSSRSPALSTEYILTSPQLQPNCCLSRCIYLSSGSTETSRICRPQLHEGVKISGAPRCISTCVRPSDETLNLDVGRNQSGPLLIDGDLIRPAPDGFVGQRKTTRARRPGQDDQRIPRGPVQSIVILMRMELASAPSFIAVAGEGLNPSCVGRAW
jgi:hypothetical protein